MAYARWGEDSDVYIIRTGERLFCLACGLRRSGEESVGWAAGKMLEHLEEHRRQGQLVPEHTLERIRQELQ